MKRLLSSPLVWIFGFAVLVFGGLGCGTTTSTGPGNAIRESTTTAESRLRVGDQIQVRVETSTAQPPQVYDLSIDDGGELALPLIDRIKADGLTTFELAQQIQAAYVPRYYIRCVVNVLVSSRFFYVGGELRSPGRYPWTKDVTLLKAINTAGGFTDFANRGRVELTRGKDKQNFDCNDLRQHPEKDLPIQPGDSIYVPRSIF